MDRFIPNRSVMDMDYALSILTQRPNQQQQQQQQQPSNPYYQALLSAALDKKPGSRIFAFGDHRNNPQQQDPLHLLLSNPSRQFPPKPNLVLDAPGLLCHDSFTALDWGGNNIIVIALSESLYAYNFDSKESFIIASMDENDEEFITGVNWNPDGNRIAVGLSNGEVQVLDVLAEKKVAQFMGGCGLGHVGSLAWNDSRNLTIARGDGKVITDWNLGSDKIVASYKGHRGKVLRLKWSPSRRWLATCGMDHIVNIWDRTKPSSQFLTFADHSAPVRGLDWSPDRSDLLVSGGLDGSIKFWSTNSSGKCLQSVNADSQVLSLFWTNCRSELLTSHGQGSPGNHVSLWRYPSMEVTGKSEHYASRLQYMAISPDGSKVASALGASSPGADDEKLMVWNFGDGERVNKYSTREKNFDFFSSFSSIRLGMVGHQSTITTELE